MLRHTFVPDYTVRAVTEVFYVKIKRSLYLAAKRATILEKRQKDPLPSQEQFDDEVEKVAIFYTKTKNRLIYHTKHFANCIRQNKNNSKLIYSCCILWRRMIVV